MMILNWLVILFLGLSMLYASVVLSFAGFFIFKHWRRGTWQGAAIGGEIGAGNAE